MALIIMADDGIPFDGSTPEKGPLGGAESAFVSLANALAARGHSVEAFTKCDRALAHLGVAWQPLSAGLPHNADLYIANRSDKLIRAVKEARKRIFWIHNPAGYLLKFRYLWKLAAVRPTIVFSGEFHRASCPGWVPASSREIIPYGMSEPFRRVERDGVPGPVAIFTSNPLRGLDWLLDIWAEKIHPACPDAELHLYSGASTYGTHGASLSDRMQPVMEKSKSLGERGVRLFDPVPKEELAKVYSNARVMLYQGDRGETFCLAVGESRQQVLPRDMQDIGCVAERVIDGVTGHVAANDDAFVTHAIRVLEDDVHWQSLSIAALDNQRQWGWDDAAAAFEKLIPA